MSFAVFNWLKTYAEWRERYLTARPEKRLFPWLATRVAKVEETWKEAVLEEDPIITLGPKGEELKNRGIMVLVVLGLVLALGRSD